LDLDPFSPYSPGILGPEKVVSTQQMTVAKTLIDLNEYCQRVDVRPKENEDDSDEEEEEIQREGKKEDGKTGKEEEGDGQQVRGAIMVALGFPTLTLDIELCNIINPEASKTIEPNASAVEVAIVPGAVEERGQAVSGTIKSTVETSVDSVANVSTLSIERTTESEAIVKRWRRDQSTSPQIQQPDILALDRDVHCQSLQDPQLSRNRRQQNRGSQGCLISFGSLQMAIEGCFSSAGPSSPLATSSPSCDRLGSPNTDSITTFPAQEFSLRGDTLPAPSISTDGSTVVFSAEQQDTIASPVSLVDTTLPVVIQGKRPANIDTTLARASGQKSVKPVPKLPDMSVFKHFRNTYMLFKRAIDDQELIVSSKVSRTGKLFANKWSRPLPGSNTTRPKSWAKETLALYIRGRRSRMVLRWPLKRSQGDSLAKLKRV